MTAQIPTALGHFLRRAPQQLLERMKTIGERSRCRRSAGIAPCHVKTRTQSIARLTPMTGFGHFQSFDRSEDCDRFQSTAVRRRKPLEYGHSRVTWLAAKHLKSPIALMTILTPSVSGSSPGTVWRCPTRRDDGDGFALGWICVIDYRPRRLDESQRRTLLELAAIASNAVKLRQVA